VVRICLATETKGTTYPAVDAGAQPYSTSQDTVKIYQCHRCRATFSLGAVKLLLLIWLGCMTSLIEGLKDAPSHHFLAPKCIDAQADNNLFGKAVSTGKINVIFEPETSATIYPK